jgi:competence protein ComEC
MIAWIPYAFVRIALVFTAGIVTGIYFPHLLNLNQLLGLALSSALAFLLLLRLHRPSAGVAALITLFFAGWYNVVEKNEALKPHHLLSHPHHIHAYQAIMIAPAEEKSTHWKQVAEVTHVYADSSWEKATGKVLLYFSKGAFGEPFPYGHRLVIKGAPQPIAPPMNPAEFDYRRFSAYKNIYHQHFISAYANVTVLGSYIPNPLLSQAYSLRARIRNLLNHHLPQPHQRAVAYALLLGMTDALDNELSQAYAAAGAMHVLAVSGLHVGIIYGLLLLLLRPLTRIRHGKWLLAAISITVLWLYAIFTGLSPSVQRAVTMFSFVALARPLSYRTNIYNILSASAFVLLIFNPYLIMSVGFQLSYMAVLGIVYLYPRIYYSWDAPGLLGDKLWQLTSVSLAAQAGTFVLGLLYFHQFPVYFLVSNLFVIPCATLVLVIGLLLILVSPIAELAQLMGSALRQLIDVLNFVVQTTEQLPLSVIEPVYISPAQSWFILGIVISILLWLEYKKHIWAITALTGALAFAILQWMHFTRHIEPAYLTIYHTPGYRALEISERGTSFFFADSALLANHEQIRFRIRPNRLHSGIKKVYTKTINQLAANSAWFVIQYRNFKILYIVKPFDQLPEGHFDVVVLGANPVINLPAQIQHTQIVTDGTMKGAALHRIAKLTQQQNWNLHATHTQGAFKIKI